MSWLFSQALVEAYSAGTSLAGAPLAQLNVTPSPHPFWRNDKTMDASALSRFGPTCAVLTERDGAAVLTSFLADFPAKESARPDWGGGSTIREADSGFKCGASLARLDPSTSLLKTHQLSLLEEGFESLEILPPWAMIVGGELYPLPTPYGLTALRSSITSESGSGLPARAPTPTAGDARSSGCRNLEGSKAHAGVSLTDYVRTGNSTKSRRVPTPLSSDSRAPGYDAGRQGSQSLSVVVRVPTPSACQAGNDTNLRCSGDGREKPNKLGWMVAMAPPKRIPTPTVQDSSNNGAPSQMERNTKPLNAEVGGPLNPTWVEWLMGWPLGWTDLNAPATDRFRQWLHLHGVSSVKPEKDK